MKCSIMGLHCLQKYLFRGFQYTKGYKASGKLNISLRLTFLPHGPLYVLYGFVELVYFKPMSHQSGILTAIPWRPRKMQNAEVRAVRSQA